ncbi:MAG: NAD(+) synthase [Bacilli bacterium]|nr:NAD(+) synthase [Bacilli bacterium]
MTLRQYLKEIDNFLVKTLDKTGAQGYVLGLSGGVDSSLVAALANKAVGREKLLCVVIPIESSPNDLLDAMKIVNLFNLNYVVYDATKIYNEYMESFLEKKEVIDKATFANLKVRIRMSILYAYAQARKSLVLGTDNADERYTGYFTKWGDGAADLLPIVHLTKGEVVEASKILGIPKELAERTPSAGLFAGQTDEKEMGVKYKDLDAYLLGKKVKPEVAARIEQLHAASEHKRKDIPCPKKFVRS